MLPEAHIGHQTPTRLRIRIPSRKGDAEYFASLKKELSGYQKFQNIQVNKTTGSLLLADRKIDVRALAEHARSKKIFDLQPMQHHLIRVSEDVSAGLTKLSDDLQRATGGELDLATAAFVTLIGIGLYELLRGNLRALPWYTALWYAYGVFTKSISEKSKIA